MDANQDQQNQQQQQQQHQQDAGNRQRGRGRGRGRGNRGRGRGGNNVQNARADANEKFNPNAPQVSLEEFIANVITNEQGNIQIDLGHNIPDIVSMPYINQIDGYSAMILTDDETVESQMNAFKALSSYQLIIKLMKTATTADRVYLSKYNRVIDEQMKFPFKAYKLIDCVGNSRDDKDVIRIRHLPTRVYQLFLKIIYELIDHESFQQAFGDDHDDDEDADNPSLRRQLLDHRNRNHWKFIDVSDSSARFVKDNIIEDFERYIDDTIFQVQIGQNNYPVRLPKIDLRSANLTRIVQWLTEILPQFRQREGNPNYNRFWQFAGGVLLSKLTFNQLRGRGNTFNHYYQGLRDDNNQPVNLGELGEVHIQDCLERYGYYVLDDYFTEDSAFDRVVTHCVGILSNSINFFSRAGIKFVVPNYLPYGNMSQIVDTPVNFQQKRDSVRIAVPQGYESKCQVSLANKSDYVYGSLVRFNEKVHFKDNKIIHTKQNHIITLSKFCSSDIGDWHI